MKHLTSAGKGLSFLLIWRSLVVGLGAALHLSVMFTSLRDMVIAPVNVLMERGKLRYEFVLVSDRTSEDENNLSQLSFTFNET
jgi:hypothetical protein